MYFLKYKINSNLYFVKYSIWIATKNPAVASGISFAWCSVFLFHHNLPHGLSVFGLNVHHVDALSHV